MLFRSCTWGVSLTRNDSDKNEALLGKNDLDFKNVQAIVFRDRAYYFPPFDSYPQKKNTDLVWSSKHGVELYASPFLSVLHVPPVCFLKLSRHFKKVQPTVFRAHS